MNHKMLCNLGSKWLKKKGFSIILEEMVASTLTGEQPDVLGFKNGYSVLIEAKFSRGDFLKDKDKFFRKKHDKGVGNYRLYICPTNLIAKEEIPEGWGLLYVDEKLKVEEIIGPKGNSFGAWSGCKYFDSNLQAEKDMLISVVRRFKTKENNKNYNVYILEDESTKFFKKELFCPKCNKIHIDEGIWEKRLHLKHLCLHCNHIWELDDYVFGIKQ